MTILFPLHLPEHMLVRGIYVTCTSVDMHVPNDHCLRLKSLACMLPTNRATS